VLQSEEFVDGIWIEPAAMDRRVADEDSRLTDAICLIWKRYRESMRPDP
jgi:hypothetical protein